MICGVDVSKKSLDVRIGAEGPAAPFSNTPEGIAALAEFCQSQGAHLVAMEATGGYEKEAFALLWAREVPVAILNPRSVRHFAEAMGLLEKTDAIDAGVIAWFAQTKHCVATRPASDKQQQLKAFIIRLRQLTDLQAGQRNQRLLVTEPRVLESFQQILTLLKAQIHQLLHGTETVCEQAAG
jgi:transposase